jgi:hypothetical protein
MYTSYTLAAVAITPQQLNLLNFEKMKKEDYKGENFNTIEGAWDWHSRAIPETVYSPEELEFLMGEQIMFKADFEESTKALTQIISVDFAYWLSNNWFIPSHDGYWVLDKENEEFERTIPESDETHWCGEELFEMFNNKIGCY